MFLLSLVALEREEVISVGNFIRLSTKSLAIAQKSRVVAL